MPNEHRPILSHCRLIEKIGEDRLGVVYRAVDTRLRRPAAVKLFTRTDHSDSASRKSFLREARIAASLNHPNIVTVYQVGEVEADANIRLETGSVSLPTGTPYIVMELVEGETLDDIARRGTRLSDTDLVDIAIQIARGLQEAHSRGIVHRDLKPASVVLTLAGQAKILDFGLGRTAASGVDPSQDIFAFGMIVRELASGEIPSGLEAIVRRCLENDPADRYADTGELVRALEAVQESIIGRVMGRAKTPRRILFLGVLAFAAIAVAIGAWKWGVFSSTGAPSPSRPPSIAVLPMSNESSDPEDTAHVADGIGRAVVEKLRRIVAM